MAKLMEELTVTNKWEVQTMILRLDPHGFGLFPAMHCNDGLVRILMIMIIMMIILLSKTKMILVWRMLIITGEDSG